MTASDRLSLVSVPIPVERGVHSYLTPEGATIFLAVTSRGALLNGELRQKLPEETDDSVSREMWRDLNRQDPVTATSRPRFGLYVGGAQRV